MKIGKFAAENNISIDTIRHYMELALIIPEKKGGHYDFDDRCKKDLYDILSLKEMGFTLNEIKSIFAFKRLGKITPYEKDLYYRQFFINKNKEVTEKMHELSHIKTKLDLKIKELSAEECKKSFKIGVDIQALNLFKCVKCNGDLILYEGNIFNNEIINGKLKCSCGEEYIIDDGILSVKDESYNDDNRFDYSYLTEYINETAPEYLDNVYRGLEWMYKHLNFNEFKNKVILDLGSGMGFFLRHIYEDLPDDSLYIAIDCNIRKHRFLKNMMEKARCKKKVIFICSDFLNIPLKDRIVDILVDYSGTSNYSFENEGFLLNLIDHHIKNEAVLLGAFILFKNFSVNTLVEDKFRKNFILENIREKIHKLNYKTMHEGVSNIVEHGGKYENYFKNDEKVYSCIFYAKR